MTLQQTIEEAQRAFQEGRVAEAERLLRNAVRADPQSAGAHIALAKLYANKDQHGDAADSFGNAMRLDRNQKGLALAYALSCFRAGRYEESEKSARFALQADPKPGIYDTLACALREQGKTAEALAAVEDALRLAPDHTAAQHTKGTILLAMGRDAEALAIFEGLDQRGVTAPAVTLNRGAALEKLGRAQEAQRLYTDAAARWPNFRELQRERAQRRH
jgi:predicted Zn-dependent protease